MTFTDLTNRRNVWALRAAYTQFRAYAKYAWIIRMIVLYLIDLYYNLNYQSSYAWLFCITAFGIYLLCYLVVPFALAYLRVLLIVSPSLDLSDHNTLTATSMMRYFNQNQQRRRDSLIFLVPCYISLYGPFNALWLVIQYEDFDFLFDDILEMASKLKTREIVAKDYCRRQLRKIAHELGYHYDMNLYFSCEFYDNTGFIDPILDDAIQLHYDAVHDALEPLNQDCFDHVLSFLDRRDYALIDTIHNNLDLKHFRIKFDPVTKKYRVPYEFFLEGNKTPFSVFNEYDPDQARKAWKCKMMLMDDVFDTNVDFNKVLHGQSAAKNRYKRNLTVNTKLFSDVVTDAIEKEEALKLIPIKKALEMSDIKRSKFLSKLEKLRRNMDFFSVASKQYCANPITGLPRTYLPILNSCRDMILGDPDLREAISPEINDFLDVLEDNLQVINWKTPLYTATMKFWLLLMKYKTEGQMFTIKHDFTDKVEQVVMKTTDLMKNIIEKGVKLNTSFDGIQLPDKEHMFKVLYFIFGIPASVYVMACSKSKLVKATTLLSNLIVGTIISDNEFLVLTSRLSSAILAVQIRDDVLEGQSNAKQLALDSAVMAALAYFHRGIFKTTVEKSDDVVMAFLKSTGELPKVGNGLSYVIDKVTSLFSSFASWSEIPFLRDWFLKDDRFAEVSQLCEKLIDLKKIYYHDSNTLPHKLAELRRRVLDVKTDFELYFDHMPKTPEYKDVRTYFLTLYNEVLRFHKDIVGTKLFDQANKVDPVTLAIRGPPGIGKSDTGLLLAVDICSNLVTKEELRYAIERNITGNWVYTHCVGQEYFEGYRSQMCMIFDDPGCMRYGPGCPDPFNLQLLQLVSPGKCLLNMAFEGKGKIECVSDLMIFFLNEKKITAEEFKVLAAVHRRYKICRSAFVKKEYSTRETADGPEEDRRPDWEHINSTLGEGSPYHLCYAKWDHTTGAIDYEDFVEYDDLVKDVVRAVKRARLHHHSTTNFLQNKLRDNYNELFNEDAGSVVSSDISCPSNCSEGSIVFDSDDYMCTGCLTKWPIATQNVAVMDGYLTRFYKNIKSSMSILLSSLRKPWLLGLVTLSAGFAVIVVQYFKDLWYVEGQDQSVKLRKVVRRRHKRNFVSVKPKPPVVPENGELAQSFQLTKGDMDVMDKIFYNNCYKVYVRGSSGDWCTTPLTRCTFLTGKIAMFVEHTWNAIMDLGCDGDSNDFRPGFSIKLERYVQNGSCGEELLLADSDNQFVKWFKPTSWVDDDIIAIRFTKMGFNAKHLNDHVGYVESELPFNLCTYVLKDGCVDTTTPINLRTISVTGRVGGFTSYDTGTFEDGSTIYYSCSRSYVGKFPNFPGMCGTPVFGKTDVGLVKWIGLHVAGNKDHLSRSVAFHPEMLIEIEKSGFSSGILIDKLGPNDVEEDYKGNVGFTQECKATRRLKRPMATDYVRSPLAGVIGDPGTKPVDLSQDAFEKAVCDISRIHPALPYTLVEKIAEKVAIKTVSKIQVNWTSPDDQVWSVDKACRGDEICGGALGPIRRSTSLGYMEGFEGNMNNSKQCFVREKNGIDEWNFESPDAKWIIDKSEESLALLRKGEMPFECFRMLMKDEVRKEGKQGRIFFACSMSLLIVCRRLFGSLCSAINKAGFQADTMIGHNPYVDAEQLWQYLCFTNGGRDCIAGDFKFWDQSIHPFFIQCFEYLSNAYYLNARLEDQIARHTLIHFLSNAKAYVEVYGEDLVIMTIIILLLGINPSGQPLTTHINCFINHTASLTAQVSVMFQQKGLGDMFEYSDTKQHEAIINHALSSIRTVVLGDDNLMNVGHNNGSNGFNITMALLVPEYKKLGFTYTPEDKSEELYTTKHLKDCSIVGRTFGLVNIRRGFHRVMKLRISSIQEMLCWYRSRSKSPHPQLDAVEDALRELVFYGREFFELQRDKIVSAYRMHYPDDPPPKNVDFSKLFDEMTDESGEWKLF